MHPFGFTIQTQSKKSPQSPQKLLSKHPLPHVCIPLMWVQISLINVCPFVWQLKSWNTSLMSCDVLWAKSSSVSVCLHLESPARRPPNLRCQGRAQGLGPYAVPPLAPPQAWHGVSGASRSVSPSSPPWPCPPVVLAMYGVYEWWRCWQGLGTGMSKTGTERHSPALSCLLSENLGLRLMGINGVFFTLWLALMEPNLSCYTSKYQRRY